MRYPPGSAGRPVIGSCVVDRQQHIDAAPGSSAYWSTVLCSDITLRVAPRGVYHQQRKPTRPPTTTTAATEMPAMAPEERLGPPLLAAPPITRWQRTGPLLLGGAAQVTQPLTPLTLPLSASQDAHVLPERSVQRDGAQTRCTVPQVGLREAGGSQSGTARCGGGSGDRRPSKTNHRPPCGGCQGCA